MGDVDLSEFHQLEVVSKPMKSIPMNPKDFKQVDYIQKYEAEMQRQAPLQADAELKDTFSKCQIASVEKDNMTWRAKIKPGNLACKSPSTHD